jgi:hypothetical protein
VAWAVTAEPAEPVRFNRDIRPILADTCLDCHGPDSLKRKAGLRLDTRDGLRELRAGRAVVAAGHPEDSLLFQRITAADPDELMPPPKTGKKLSASQIATLRRWIADDAPWEGHWAYQPPQRPPLPRVRNASWAVNPVDRFILARLESDGLDPSSEADRRTLLRRLSYDLTGLPPTPAEVGDFRQDNRPEAYALAVERLLASPHFGERMALHWLDLVRYADTDGFHADNYRSVWPYRDYVIRAFNANLPFDRFTLEQLAGDLLPNPTLDQRVASTYNRLGRTTEEGGAQPKEYLAKYAADRVRSLGIVWLGTTTGCAECHDHKYDPLTTRDFYRLEAYFADVKEQGVGKAEGSPVPSETEAAELQRLDDRLARLDQSLRQVDPGLRPARAAWESDLVARLTAGSPAWSLVRPGQAQSAAGATLTIQDDLSVLASGLNPDHDTYTVSLALHPGHWTALRLEVLRHPTHVKESLSRANGNIVLTGVEIELSDPTTNSPPRRLAIGSAVADFAQDGYPVQNTLDDKPDTGWAVAGHEKPAEHQAAFRFLHPLETTNEVALTLRLKHESQFKQHNIGRFRLALASIDQPTLDPLGIPPDVADALRKPLAERNTNETSRLDRHFLDTAPALDSIRADQAAARKERDSLLGRIPTTLMTVAVAPRPTRVLPRGNWLDDSGETVTPAPPEFLAGPPSGSAPATRLDLARWLVSPENPLVARVVVNRLWRLFFGIGLARNLDDLGSRGEWPSHPELLDWLAVEFRESGWDIKRIVRRIVTSNTYRQSSLAPESLRTRDPDNRLLARQAVRRLDAEMVRDTVLAVSGLLVSQLGGPSAKPYQPDGYWDQLNFPKRKWQRDSGTALYRRGLYTLWCRSFLHPSLLAFDACPREEGVAERPLSNTPLQTLALLNDPSYVEAARVLAERTLEQPAANPELRLRWLFRQTLARDPTQAELDILRALHRDQQAGFNADPATAAQLLGVGDRPAPSPSDPVGLAAWTGVARAVLNLHETLYRY